MKKGNLWVVSLLCLLGACGREEPPRQQERGFGGQLGDSYKGMLDEARQGAGQLDEQLQRTGQSASDRDR